MLATHPRVAEVAIVGAPDATWGEAVAAAVVPVAGDDGAGLLEALATHVTERLADYKKPRRLLVLDALPRNALGKVQKHALKARFHEA